MFSAAHGVIAKSKVVSRVLRDPFLALSIFFIWVAATRIFYVVLHDPMYGYGNQFDMGRTAACLDLWPDSPAGPQDIAYFNAPKTKHVRAAISSQSCYPSAEALLDMVAIKLDGVRTFLLGDKLIDLRVIGLFKGLLLVLAACVANDALRRSPQIAMFHALTFLLVIADPVVTLYLNTLYGEFVAVFGVYAAFIGIVALTLTRQWTAATITLVASGISCLAFSRLQHILLPIFLIAWLGLLQLKGTSIKNWFRDQFATCILIVFLATVTVGGIVVNVQFMKGNPVFHEVNRNNMLFGALLPATANPDAVIDALGLPPQCEELVYSDFFRKALRGRSGSCPEALATSPIRLLWVFATEPTAIATVFSRGIMLASAWRMPYVGEVAGANFVRASPGPFGIAASVDSLSRKMSYTGQMTFWLVPIICGLLAGLSLASGTTRHTKTVQRHSNGLGTVAIFMLSLIVVSAWTSSLFGDGYSELSRHVHLGIVAALASWILLIGMFILYRPVWMGVSALVIVAGSVAFLSTIPVGFGRLSDPASDAKLATGTMFSGWVIAPYHVTAIDIEQRGQRLFQANVTPSKLFARHHPFNKGQNAFEFAFNATSTSPSFESGVPIKVYAVNANNQRELVDVRHWCLDTALCRPSPQ